MTKIEDIAIVDTHSEDKEYTTSDSENELYALEYLYKSDNGEIVDVTFFEEGDKMNVKIKRDKQDELILPQTTAWAKGAEYESGNYKWVSQEDGATFSDGNNTMKLVVISPLQYTYTNEKESIVVIYSDKNDKRFVTLIKDNQPEITLEQTEAWAKGAEYGNNTVKWHNQGDTGTLTEDGVASKFKK